MRSAREPSSAPERGAVVFVSVTGGLGGPSRSLATLLDHLSGQVERVLFAPNGSLTELARGRGSVEYYVRLPHWRRLSRLSRLLAAARILGWAIRRRRRILAFHANGQAELNLVGPAAILARLPVVMWAHASEASPSARFLERWWKRLLTDVRLAAVSVDAADVLRYSGIAAPATEVTIVPNPIDPRDVVAAPRRDPDRITIGFFRGRGGTTGFDLLPDVIDELFGLPLRWLVFASVPRPNAPSRQLETWARLAPFVGDRLEMRGKVPRVDLAYAECDIVFCPSSLESFGRVAAEAMMNGIPVVASDIKPLRRLIGDDEAGLLFPVGDFHEAAKRIRCLAEDEVLRHQLGDRGRKRAEQFLPKDIVDRMCRLYGVAQGGE